MCTTLCSSHVKPSIMYQNDQGDKAHQMDQGKKLENFGGNLFWENFSWKNLVGNSNVKLIAQGPDKCRYIRLKI